MKIDFFGYRVRAELSFSKTVEVAGINSKIKDSDKHILLWDFDNAILTNVLQALRPIQGQYLLPDIHVIKTTNGFHAYCFHPVSFPTAMKIIAETKGIDMTFFRIGVVRGFWTLRISGRKSTDSFNEVAVMRSSYPETLELATMLDNTIYRTGQK